MSEDAPDIQDFPFPETFTQHFWAAMMRDAAFPITAQEQNGEYVQFGSGNKVLEGFRNWDWPDWDADSGEPIPIPDEKLDGIVCYHTLDHLAEPIRVMAEFQRVLKPMAWLVVCMPHYSSELWHTDLTHKSQFGIETWRSMFSERHYSHKGVVAGHVEWKLDVVFNMLVGVTERNLCLFTQFRKSI